MDRDTIWFDDLIAHLEKRPGMYVNPVGFATIVAYLSGVDCGIVSLGHPSMFLAFSEWLHRKLGHHCSLHWSAVIRDTISDGDEDVAVKDLFRLLREFRSTKNRKQDIVRPRGRAHTVQG